MLTDAHYWIKETLYCPESGDMHITEHEDGSLMYETGNSVQLISGKNCPECGEETPALDTDQPVYSRAYQQETLALGILADGENEEEEED